jgi:hypothetical protein
MLTERKRADDRIVFASTVSSRFLLLFCGSPYNPLFSQQTLLHLHKRTGFASTLVYAKHIMR